MATALMHILIVDDEEAVLESLKFALMDQFTIFTSSNGKTPSNSLKKTNLRSSFVISGSPA